MEYDVLRIKDSEASCATWRLIRQWSAPSRRSSSVN